MQESDSQVPVRHRLSLCPPHSPGHTLESLPHYFDRSQCYKARGAMEPSVPVPIVPGSQGSHLTHSGGHLLTLYGELSGTHSALCISGLHLSPQKSQIRQPRHSGQANPPALTWNRDKGEPFCKLWRPPSALQITGRKLPQTWVWLPLLHLGANGVWMALSVF